MHQIALNNENHCWIMVTNGKEYFLSKKDIRHYSKPPNINQPKEKGENQIFKISLDNHSAEEYFNTINASIIDPINTSQKAKKYY